MIQQRTKYYFVSDVHLRPSAPDAHIPEERFLSFLESVEEDAVAIYLLGDIFDYWYEYKYTIPRGYTRVLGKLAQLVDRGVKIYFTPGNHDVWSYNYFEQELGIEVFDQPHFVSISGKKFCLGHGDGLGYTALGFSILRYIFHNKFIQKLYSAIHPRWSFALGYAWSAHSRNRKKKNLDFVHTFKGCDEPIYKYAVEIASEKDVDCFVFGHFHTPTRQMLPGGEEFFILGEWSLSGEYLVFDSLDNSLVLRKVVFGA